jgi:hypothetical protein
MKVTDLSLLDLPDAWNKTLEGIVSQDRMHYDLWIDSANDVIDLQNKLRLRGYKQLPIMTSPLVWLSSIPMGVENKNSNRLFTQNNVPPVSPLAIKKMHLAHEKLFRSTP